MKPEMQQRISESPLESAWSDYREARARVAAELAQVVAKKHDLDDEVLKLHNLANAIEAMI